MAWKINCSHIEDDRERSPVPVAIYGPHSITHAQRAALDAGRGFSFRLYDDAGALYFRGITLVDPMKGDADSLFAPLDDYGDPDAGCTTIKYLINERWEAL